MSETKHTPGPWRIGIGGERENGKYPITAIYDSRCIYVASACADMEVILHGERAANARLISAAPDLLEALSDLVKADDVKMGRKSVQIRIEAARAAIAKAKGQP